MIFYGDIALDIDINKFMEFDTLSSSIATIIVHPNDHPYDSDIVEINNKNIVINFHSKPHNENSYYNNMVNAAVYILDISIFKYITSDIPSDFGKDIFPNLLKNNKIIKAYKTSEYIKDIGTIERINKVNKDFLNGKVSRYSKRNKRPAIFLDRDGTIIKYVNLLHKAEDIVLFSYTASSIKKINKSDYLCFLVTNQPVVARNLCNMDDLKKIHNRLETLLGKEGAFLNDIYLCPHHQEKGYPEENADFKIDCICRKPKTGMIDIAVDEYNIDISSSWFIGDTTTDVQTGINANIRTILLRTGVGGKDKKFNCIADYICDNLEDAIDFIIANQYRYNEIIKQIIHNIKPKEHLPYIISIAGLSRSGKSTFANILRDTLLKNGFSCQILSLDNWIVGNNERIDKMTVRDRYKYTDIEADIIRILRGEQIYLKVYESYSRNTMSESRCFFNNTKCLIIDGVPALDIDVLRTISDFRIYIDIDETIRKKRFISYYKWKELSDDSIKILYDLRLNDECVYITDTKKYADIIINGNNDGYRKNDY